MKSILYIASLVLLFSSCSKEEFTIQNLNNNKIDVLGHAGSGISNLYPINSMESFIRCFTDGANGTELDVQLTKDSVLVAFHDESLENSTNLEGLVRSKTWDEISQGYYDVVPYTEYNIVRVRDLLDNASTSDRIFTFDIKKRPAEQEDVLQYYGCFARTLKKLFDDYDLYNRAFVEAQYEAFIVALQNESPAIRQFIFPQVFEDGLAIAQARGLYGITISTHNINKEQVTQAHDLGFHVTIWDVSKRPEIREAVRKNPDMIQTDNVPYLVKILE